MADKDINGSPVDKESTEDVMYATLFDHYDNGRYEVAYNLALELAGEGHGRAYNMLGIFYANGDYVEQSFPKAIEYYEIACGKGWHGAFYNLGWHYRNGLGVELDLTKAYHLYKKAAEFGKGYAQFEFGMLTLNGVGTNHDLDVALEYIQNARMQDFQPAIDFILSLYAILKPEICILDNIESSLSEFDVSRNISNDIFELIKDISDKEFVIKTTDTKIFKAMKISTSNFDKDVLTLNSKVIKQWSAYLRSLYCPNRHMDDAYINHAVEIVAFLHFANALILYLNCEAPPDELNMPMLSELASAAISKNDHLFSSSKSDLDRLFNMLEEKNNKHPALNYYRWYKALVGGNCKKIACLFQESLAPLGPSNDFLKHVTSKEDITNLVSLLNLNLADGKMSKGTRFLLCCAMECLLYTKMNHDRSTISSSVVKKVAIDIDSHIGMLDSNNVLVNQYNEYRKRHCIDTDIYINEINQLFLFYDEFADFDDNMTEVSKVSSYDASETIDVVKLYDDKGQGVYFELLAISKENDASYFILTPYDESCNEDDNSTISDVFIMREIVIDDEKQLEPVHDILLANKIYERFKIDNADDYSFAN